MIRNRHAIPQFVVSARGHACTREGVTCVPFGSAILSGPFCLAALLLTAGATPLATPFFAMMATSRDYLQDNQASKSCAVRLLVDPFNRFVRAQKRNQSAARYGMPPCTGTLTRWLQNVVAQHLPQPEAHRLTSTL